MMPRWNHSESNELLPNIPEMVCIIQEILLSNAPELTGTRQETLLADSVIAIGDLSVHIFIALWMSGPSRRRINIHYSSYI